MFIENQEAFSSVGPACSLSHHAGPTDLTKQPVRSASFKDYFCLRSLTVNRFSTRAPFTVFELFCLHAKSAIRQPFERSSDFAHGIAGACHHFVRQHFAIFELHRAHSAEICGREVVERDLLLLLVPHDNRLAAVSAAVYRMKDTDRFSIQCSLPAHNIHDRSIGLAVFEYALPRLVQEWPKRFEMRIEQGCVGAKNTNPMQ